MLRLQLIQMGQVQPNKESFLTQFQKQSTQHHPLFGHDVDVYSKGEQSLFVVHRVFQSELHYIKELRRLDVYKDLSQIQGLLQLLEVQKTEESNLCSNIFKIDAVYEFAHPLPQIPWTLFLQQTVHTLLELQNKDKYHGDLRPHSFLYTNQVKTLLPNVDQYNKFLSGFEESCYLAPELFTQLGRRVFKPEFNQEKSDVFTLGLVCLEMTLQEKLSGIYDFQEYQLNQIVLDQYIRRSKVQLIQRMLRTKPEDRPTFMQIYETSIVDMMEESISKSGHVGHSMHAPQPSLQFLAVTQSPNNRYSGKSSRQPSRVPDYGFLQDQQVHIPFNPGSDYLDSSRYRDSNTVKLESVHSSQQQGWTRPGESTRKLESAQRVETPSQKTVSVASTNQKQKPKAQQANYKVRAKGSTPLADISNKGKKPTLMRSTREDVRQKSKSPLNLKNPSGHRR